MIVMLCLQTERYANVALSPQRESVAPAITTTPVIVALVPT